MSSNLSIVLLVLVSVGLLIAGWVGSPRTPTSKNRRTAKPAAPPVERDRA
jgi:hypothetical protein